MQNMPDIPKSNEPAAPDEPHERASTPTPAQAPNPKPASAAEQPSGSTATSGPAAAPKPAQPISLPDDAALREKMASIIAQVCRCEPGPLLEDQEFSAVITQFDSLAVLEILLEVETEFHIQTDDMLPLDHTTGAQEITTVFPKNLSQLIVYMREVAARVTARQEAGEDTLEALKQARRAAAAASKKAEDAQAARPPSGAPDSGPQPGS